MDATTQVIEDRRIQEFNAAFLIGLGLGLSIPGFLMLLWPAIPRIVGLVFLITGICLMAFTGLTQRRAKQLPAGMEH